MGEVVWVMLRGVLFAELVAVFGATAVILMRLKRERENQGFEKGSLMPTHILLVGVGVLIVAASIASTQFTNITLKPDWNTVPLQILGWGIFLAGLWLMLLFQNRAYGSRERHQNDPAIRDFGSGLSVPVVTLFLINFVAMAAVVWAIEEEANERRDQNCLSFEGAHRDEVRQLSETYKFIAQQTDAERASTLSRFVTSGLAQLEAEAASDADNKGVQVPKYCDEDDVGLEEPDPVVPKRPDNLELSK